MENLKALLAARGLGLADVEASSLERVNLDDAEALARLVRVTATNRELRRHGLAPLLHRPQQHADAEGKQHKKPRGLVPPDALLALYDDELEGLERVGLPREEYLAIRGRYGTVMGLRLDEWAYKRARLRCRSKQALALRDDPDAARAYLCEELRKTAQLKVARMQPQQPPLPKPPKPPKQQQQLPPATTKEEPYKKRRIDCTDGLDGGS